jgi:hypothetical protein
VIPWKVSLAAGFDKAKPLRMTPGGFAAFDIRSVAHKLTSATAPADWPRWPLSAALDPIFAVERRTASFELSCKGHTHFLQLKIDFGRTIGPFRLR